MEVCQAATGSGQRATGEQNKFASKIKKCAVMKFASKIYFCALDLLAKFKSVQSSMLFEIC